MCNPSPLLHLLVMVVVLRDRYLKIYTSFSFFLLTSFVCQESITSFVQPPATVASDTSDKIPMGQVIYMQITEYTHVLLQDVTTGCAKPLR